MKASWWKFVLLALISAGIIACGSDNKTGATNAVTASNPVSNGVSTAPVSSIYEEFRQQVINGQFVAQNNNFEKYLYSNIQYSSNGSSNSNCNKILGFINWCTSTSSSNTSSGSFDRTSDKVSGVIKHEAGAVNAVAQQLASIVNNASYTQQYSQTSWLVHHADGSAYLINLSYPMVANPMAYRPAGSGLGYSFYTYQYNNN